MRQGSSVEEGKGQNSWRENQDHGWRTQWILRGIGNLSPHLRERDREGKGYDQNRSLEKTFQIPKLTVRKL